MPISADIFRGTYVCWLENDTSANKPFSDIKEKATHIFAVKFVKRSIFEDLVCSKNKWNCKTLIVSME